MAVAGRKRWDQGNRDDDHRGRASLEGSLAETSGRSIRGRLAVVKRSGPSRRRGLSWAHPPRTRPGDNAQDPAWAKSLMLNSSLGIESAESKCEIDAVRYVHAIAGDGDIADVSAR